MGSSFGSSSPAGRHLHAPQPLRVEPAEAPILGGVVRASMGLCARPAAVDRGQRFRPPRRALGLTPTSFVRVGRGVLEYAGGFPQQVSCGACGDLATTNGLPNPEQVSRIDHQTALLRERTEARTAR